MPTKKINIKSNNKKRNKNLKNVEIYEDHLCKKNNKKIDKKGIKIKV